jgi:hypothetical protein
MGARSRRRTACACDLRSRNVASLQHPASIDYLRYGALQICIGLQSLRFSVAVCGVRLARRHEGNDLRCNQRWKICKLQPTITVHCRIVVAGVNHLKLNSTTNVSHRTLQSLARSTMTGTKASASSADE